MIDNEGNAYLGGNDGRIEILDNETRLQPDQYHISIYFHTLNFSNIDADLYYYKLAGIDKEWVGPTNKTYVLYPYLNAVEYTFVVKSKNELSGLFSDPAEFSFIILKPWYKQTWFIIFMAVLVLSIVSLFYKFRINSIRKQEKKKREVLIKISELEAMALQARMNPHSSSTHLAQYKTIYSITMLTMHSRT